MKKTLSKTVKMGMLLLLTDVSFQIILSAVSAVLLLMKLLPQEASEMMSTVIVPLCAFAASYIIFQTQNNQKWLVLAIGQGMYLILQIIILATSQYAEPGTIITELAGVILMSFAGMLLANFKKPGGSRKKYEKFLSKSMR